MPDHDNWDSHWDRYAAAASLNPAQRMRHDLVAGVLAPSAGAAGARILDIGSGQGDLAARLRPAFPRAEIVGFELSASGVEISRRKVANATFLEVDVFSPPRSAAVYDGWATHSVCSEVLEHVDSPVQFLQAARRYLAPGALLVVTVPGGPMSAFDRLIGHRRHFDRESIREVLREAGFRTGFVYRSGFPFFNLYRGLVIARGDKLAGDVESRGGAPSRLARAAMALFRAVFPLNLRDSALGWQIVAVAHA